MENANDLMAVIAETLKQKGSAVAEIKGHNFCGVDIAFANDDGGHNVFRVIIVKHAPSALRFT